MAKIIIGNTGGVGNVIQDTVTGFTAQAENSVNIPGQAGLKNLQKALDRQPKTTNGILPTSYKFSLARAPHLVYFCQSLSVPEISIDRAVQESIFSDINIPAGKPTFGDLTLNFVVDEKMENWLEIYNWMTGLVPLTEISSKAIVKSKDRFSDASVVITTNQANGQYMFDFKDIYPISLGELEFTSVDTAIDPITCQVTFAYSTYAIRKINS